MRNVKAVVLGLYLLTAFVPAQGVAMASYSNDEKGYSEKDDRTEGSHGMEMDDKQATLMQAAKELKASDPELSAKLDKLAATCNIKK